MTDEELGTNPCLVCGHSLEVDAWNYFEEDWPLLCDGFTHQCPEKVAWEKRLEQYIDEEVSSHKAE